MNVTASGIFLNKEDENKIAEWMGEHFWLYNNKYGNKFSRIEQFLRVKLQECKADLCVIDNLMALDLAEYDREAIPKGRSAFRNCRDPPARASDSEASA